MTTPNLALYEVRASFEFLYLAPADMRQEDVKQNIAREKSTYDIIPSFDEMGFELNKITNKDHIEKDSLTSMPFGVNEDIEVNKLFEQGMIDLTPPKSNQTKKEHSVPAGYKVVQQCFPQKKVYQVIDENGNKGWIAENKFTKKTKSGHVPFEWIDIKIVKNEKGIITTVDGKSFKVLWHGPSYVKVAYPPMKISEGWLKFYPNWWCSLETTPGREVLLFRVVVMNVGKKYRESSVINEPFDDSVFTYEDDQGNVYVFNNLQRKAFR